MDIGYLVAQIAGIAATACCLILPLFKHKWQMLTTSIAANIFFVLNIFLLEGLTTAAILNTVATGQAILALWYNGHDKPVTIVENTIFLVIYIAFGVMGFRRLIDIMPLVATVLNMFTTFQRDERRSRYLILSTATIYSAYFAIIGSTSIFAELCAIVTTLIAMYRYRQAKPEARKENAQ